MSLRFAVITYALVLFWFSIPGSVFSELPAPTSSLNPSSLSPDKKWEYSDGDTPKLVKAGSNEVAMEFSEGCDLGALGEHSELHWAPDQNALHFIAVERGKSISLYSTNYVMMAGWR
jgi:hypothetical protein